MAKKIALGIGILGMILSSIGLTISLLLPVLTDNHVDYSEALIGIIPSILIFGVSFLITVISAIMLIKGRRKVVAIPAH